MDAHAQKRLQLSMAQHGLDAIVAYSKETWVTTADEILAKAVRKPRVISESGH